MENEILFYKKNGELKDREILDNDNLQHINGMMTRCKMQNGTIEIGFSDTFRDDNGNYDCVQTKNYIFLRKWANLDEEKHQLIGSVENKYNQIFKKIMVKDIIQIEAILYSNPRWGGMLTNEFILEKSKEK